MSAQRLYHNMPYSVVAFVALVPVSAVWVFLIGGGILRAGGVFEYPLDDVYIHLAMAEQIAGGGYGVNINEAASAASSPLYPFLLAPFAQDSIGRVMPFALNLIAMVGAVWVWALICWRALPEDKAGRAWVLIGAGLAPAGLNLAGATMTAMEHTPHIAATPVAVNDLGRVAWGNDNYVLDLWGLGNAQARAMRLNQPQVGWADELVSAQNVPLVMVYDHWIDEGLGHDWTRLGALRMQNPAGFLGGAEVQFYAADPAFTRSLTAALRLWETGLPRDAVFDFSKESV